MRYKNTKTGAVIDSPFVIKGDNWEEIKPKSKPRPKKKTVKKEETESGD